MAVEVPAHLQFMIDDGIANDPTKGDDPAPPAPPAPPTPPVPPAPLVPPGNDPAPPAPPTPEDVAFDTRFQERLGKMFTEKFGEEAKNVDDIHKLYTSSKERETSYQEEKKILEAKASASIDWADDSIAEFNSFAKETGIISYPIFQRIKGNSKETAAANPLDALITQEIIDNPEYADNPDYFKRRILKKYGFESAEEFEANDNEDIAMDMKVDANQALKKITEYQSKIKKPEAVDYEKQQKDRQQLFSETSDKLRGVVDKMTDGLSKFVYAPAEGIPYEFKFDEKTVTSMKESIVRNQAGLKDPYDQKAYQQNINNVYAMAVASNIKEIMASHATNVRGLTDEEFRKQYTNPSAIDPKDGDPRNTSGSLKTDSDIAFEWAMGKRQG